VTIVHQPPGPQVGGAVPAVLGTGNLPGAEAGRKPISLAQTLSLLHYETWAKGRGE